LLCSKQPDAHEASERRASPRVPLEVDVSFTSESHFFVGLTGDLSEGGLFVATWRQLSVGTQVDVALSLPDGILTACGHVRWMRHATEAGAPGVGLSFDELGERDRARIEAFCAARAPWYYDLDE
jgi:uncharacterized protein (TIGR02266 family)